jgi:hypothetical protein
MFVVESVREWDHLVIPGCPPVSLIASNQENRHSARIEREQDADATCGWPELFHVRVSRPMDRVYQRPAEPRPLPLKMLHRGNNRVLLNGCQVDPLSLEFVGVLDFPAHDHIIMFELYNAMIMIWAIRDECLWLISPEQR